MAAILSVGLRVFRWCGDDTLLRIASECRRLIAGLEAPAAGLILLIMPSRQVTSGPEPKCYRLGVGRSEVVRL
jgi:hypothetical protein